MKNRVVRAVFAAAVVAVGCGSAWADGASHEISDYVQDGLICHFDGIYNVGVDLEHNPNTGVWKELTGKSTDGTINFKEGKWMDGAFLRTGPNSSGPGYGKTSYLEYSLPQSFVDNLNAGGGYTIEVLTHFIGNSAGPGALFALGGRNTTSYLHLSANADRLTHRGVTAGANANTFFGSLSSAKTNTVTAIYDGKVSFSQYRNAQLVKTLVCNEAPLRTVQADSALVGTFSAGSDWGSSVDAYAIRIYDRPLTEKEVAKNNRVDDERYFGSNVTWVVQVSGDYGNPTPAKGVSRVVPGSGFAVESATESVGAGARMALSGWTWTPDVGEPVSGTTAEPTVVATGDGDFAWRWKKQYEITASAGAGGAVSTAGGWTDEGASVTFTATPDAGKKFLGWSGETAGLAIDTASATITFAADRARALTANFTDAAHEPTTATFVKKGEAGDFSWNDPEIWGGTLPGEGDEVVIEGESGKEPVITIDGPLPTFKSVFIRYAKVNFKGWNNALRATGDVTLSSFGKLTHEKATADLAAEQSRVWVVCENFSIVNSGSCVSVNGKGWPAVTGGRGISPTMNERSYSGCCGGVYGGLAGVGYGGSCSAQPFGSIEHPRELGTSGSTTSATATPGCGGGAVLIQARGTVTVGSAGIQANAGNGSGSGYYGGGSGGSVEIECETIEGSGEIQACGGGGGNGWGASGSGGRIAINCNAAKQDALGYSKLTFLARPGAGWNGAYCFGGNQTVSEHGSLYLAAKSLLNTNVNVSARVYFPTPSLTVAELNVPNQRRVEFQQDGFQLKVAGNVTLNGASGLVLGGDVCQYFVDNGDITPRGSRRVGGVVPVKAEIGGCLKMLGNKSEVVLYPISSGTVLDANGCPAGAVLDVGKTFTMMTGATLYPVSCGTNGISCAIRAWKLDIQAGAIVSADKLGFFGGCADNYKRLPGQTVYGYTGASWFPVSCTAGASHGGLGGGVTDERAVYDDVEHPVLPGAGSNIPNGSGLNGTGGHGGGVIHFEVARTARIAGTLKALGSTATGNGHACAAAGGSIYLKTGHLFVDEGAMLKANGCNAAGNPNAGGGGRIAIWRIYDDPGTVDVDTLTNTVCNVAGGTGNAPEKAGQPGTVYLGQLPKPGLMILVK